MWEIGVQSLGLEDLLEKGMATHSSMLAWRIPWTEEPGRLHTVCRISKSQTRLKQLSTCSRHLAPSYYSINIGYMNELKNRWINVKLHYTMYSIYVLYIILYLDFSTWSRGADGSAITQGSDLNDLHP